MATVTKRKWTYKGEEKTAWIVRYVDKSGSRKQETFERKKDADQHRVKIENELANGTHVATSDTCTVRQLAELYMADVERRLKIGDRMTLTTVKNYRNFVFNHICRQFGHMKLTALQADAIQEWLNDLCVHFKRPTVARARDQMKLLLAYGVQRRLIGRNVLLEGKVRTPSSVRKRVAVPNREQLQTLLTALETRGQAERYRSVHIRRIAIKTAMFCGLRRGELCGLQWENVNFGKQRLEIRHSYSQFDGLKSPKTHAGLRDVPMPPPVLDALREHHEACGRPTTGFVLTRRAGAPLFPSELWKYWRDLCERAGMTDEAGRPLFHLHALRHAAASLAIAKGLTPLHVKSFIGHARIGTTMDIYGHLFPEDERIALTLTDVASDFDGARLTQKTASH